MGGEEPLKNPQRASNPECKDQREPQIAPFKRFYPNHTPPLLEPRARKMKRRRRSKRRRRKQTLTPSQLQVEEPQIMPNIGEGKEL